MKDIFSYIQFKNHFYLNFLYHFLFFNAKFYNAVTTIKNKTKYLIKRKNKKNRLTDEWQQKNNQGKYLQPPLLKKSDSVSSTKIVFIIIIIVIIIIILTSYKIFYSCYCSTNSVPYDCIHIEYCLLFLLINVKNYIIKFICIKITITILYYI